LKIFLKNIAEPVLFFLAQLARKHLL